MNENMIIVFPRVRDRLLIILSVLSFLDPLPLTGIARRIRKTTYKSFLSVHAKFPAIEILYRYLKNVSVEVENGKPHVEFTQDGVLKSAELKIMNLRPGASMQLVWEEVISFTHYYYIPSPPAPCSSALPSPPRPSNGPIQRPT
jgi:hypothetical protein